MARSLQLNVRFGTQATTQRTCYVQDLISLDFRAGHKDDILVIPTYTLKEMLFILRRYDSV